MPRLRVADIDAIEQDGNLFAATAPDTDIRLRTDRAALAHVDAAGHLQQVVNTLYWRRLNVFARQYSDHSHCLPNGKRSA